MALILVVGSDTALIEGIAQTLAAAGHMMTLAEDVPSAVAALDGRRPLIAIVERGALFRDGTTFRILLAQGGALVAFHAADTQRIPLPFPVQRAVIAALELPLERKRLGALIANVETRAKAAGRADVTDQDDLTPPA